MRSTLPIVAAGLACGSPSIKAPEGSEVVAVAAMNGSRAIAASPLSDLTLPIGVEAPDDSDWLSVSGWTRAELGAWASAIETKVPLHAPVGCEPSLPRPPLHHAFELDGRPLETREAPSLGAAGVECPSSRVAIEIRLGDLGPSCPMDSWASRCATRIDLDRCDLGELHVIGDPAGKSLCIAEAKGCEWSPIRGERTRLRCAMPAGAEAVVIVHNVPAPRFVELGRALLDPEAAPVADTPGENLPVASLRFGRLRDVAVVDGVVIASLTDPPASFCGANGTLVGLSLRDLSRRFERKGRCYGRLIAQQGGFLGATLGADDFAIHRLDLEGAVTATIVSLPRRGDWPFIVDLAVDGSRIVAALASRPSTGGVRTTLVRAGDGELRIHEDEANVQGIAFAGGLLAFGDDAEDIVVWLDDASFERRAEVNMRPTEGGMETSVVVGLPPEVLVLSEADSAAVHLVSAQADLARAPFFEILGDAVSLLPQDFTVIVGGVSRYSGQRRGFIGELATPTLEYRLGSLDVGVGPVVRVVDDGEGGFVAMLPWDGSVVRVGRVGPAE